MTPTIARKMSFFIATLVVLAAVLMGAVSYILMERKLAEVLRKDTLDSATLLASRVRNELVGVGQKARLLTAAAMEEFKNPDDQIRFLEENLQIDDQFVALSLFRRSLATHDQWSPVFRLARPEGDPAHLTEEDFKSLDLKFPLDFSRTKRGGVEVTSGLLKDGTPIIRILLPIVKRPGFGYTQALSIEVRQERITAAFSEATAYFSFLTDRNGRILVQTDPTHFTFGEDASNLPILRMSGATEAPNGNLDYYELPGASLQYGSFSKVGYANLVVVSQMPKSYVIHAMRDFTRKTGMIALACVFFAAGLGLLATWGLVGSRLARIGAALERFDEEHFNVSFPEKDEEDEIGYFARHLQEVVNKLKQRGKVHGTFAKLKSRKLKTRIESGKIKLKGERMDAMVLHCHLHGVEKVTAIADAELLVRLLNQFNQSVSDFVDTQQGIVDHIHGGSVVAYWGVPIPDKKDAEHALSVAIQIREFAKVFNDQLKSHELPAVTLGMGIHYGSVVAGQVGTEERMEYTAIGEALEIASRIQSFTDQFGTDLLVTEQASSHAPGGYVLEKVSDGDEANPPLYEVMKSPSIVDMPMETTVAESSSEPTEEATPPPIPIKRKRGRPRKAAAPETVTEEITANTPVAEDSDQTAA